MNLDKYLYKIELYVLKIIPMLLYVKDVIDDVDAPDGLVFNRWYADMCYMGIAIDWEEML